jgi:hypothetical protein
MGGEQWAVRPAVTWWYGRRPPGRPPETLVRLVRSSDLGPSVLLTQAEHKEMSKKLAAAMTEVRTTKQLWQKYQEVYADHPDWLKAIEAYFKKAD